MFRTSTYSNPAGNCVEVGFRKSTYSLANGSCVEVAGGVRVRDTKNHGAGPVLSFTPAAWAAFTGGLK
jgi:hypothetical protein